MQSFLLGSTVPLFSGSKHLPIDAIDRFLRRHIAPICGRRQIGVTDTLTTIFDF